MAVTISQETFGICTTASGVMTYPPLEAKALAEGSAVVLHPVPQGFGGDGLALRLVGRPYVVVARQTITEAGYEWYWNFITNSIPTQVYIEAYEIRDKAWNPYLATMHLPTITNVAAPDTEYRLRGFECRFTNLVKQSRA